MLFRSVMTAAESGHLVISSIHTPDAATTIGKILGYYSGEDRKIMQERLVNNLKFIISLRLLQSRDLDLGFKRLPAIELLRMNSAIASCLRDPEKLHTIPMYMHNGYINRQSWTFDDYILELYQEKKWIDIETAKAAFTNPQDMAIRLQGYQLK